MEKNLQEVEIKESYTEGIFNEANFDADNLIIYNVAVLGVHSANNRTYTEPCLKEAVTIFEGMTGYLDHPSREKLSEPRRFLDAVVEHKNVRYDGSKIRSDMHFIDTRAIREEVFPRIKRLANKFGNSIVAAGQSEMKEGHEIVHKITRGYSIDIVTDPATNDGLFEAIEKLEDKNNKQDNPKIREDEPVMDKLTMEVVKGDKGIMEALKAEFLEEYKQYQEIEVIRKENENLKTENTNLKAENSRYKTEELYRNKLDTRDGLLAESSLPKEFITDEFKARLAKCEDEQDMKSMIMDLEQSAKNLEAKYNQKKVNSWEKNPDDKTKPKDIRESFAKFAH